LETIQEQKQQTDYKDLAELHRVETDEIMNKYLSKDYKAKPYKSDIVLLNQSKTIA